MDNHGPTYFALLKRFNDSRTLLYEAALDGKLSLDELDQLDLDMLNFLRLQRMETLMRDTTDALSTPGD